MGNYEEKVLPLPLPRCSLCEQFVFIIGHRMGMTRIAYVRSLTLYEGYLGDRCLSKRADQLVNAMGHHETVVVNRLSSDWNEQMAYYRFFSSVDFIVTWPFQNSVMPPDHFLAKYRSENPYAHLFN